jgi:hypothetical protein
MRRIIRLLAIVVAVASAVWLGDARKRAEERGEPVGRVLLCDLRGFVTHRLDPLVMRFGFAGGERSALGVVEHVGRATGTVHHTPVLPLVADDHAYIPLPYGPDVDWCRNVRTAGHCRLQVHDTIYELDEPALVGVGQNELLPTALRGPLERMGSQYLRLHVLDRAPGAFAHEPAEGATPATAMPGVHLEMVGEATGQETAGAAD